MKSYLISLGLYLGGIILFVIGLYILDLLFKFQFNKKYPSLAEENNNYRRRDNHMYTFVEEAYDIFFKTFVIFCFAIVAALLLFYNGKVSDSEMSKYFSIFVYVCINAIISLSVLAVFKGIHTFKHVSEFRERLLEKKKTNPTIQLKEKIHNPIHFIVENLYKPIAILFSLIVILVIK